ncbi:MAG: acyl carrier protein [Polyangiaceae bacterium]|nr:acyl carrier protein [Polyangiaceae bacterium]
MEAILHEVRRALHDHIVGEILLRRAPLGPDEDLFEAGFDSMSLARVLVFVERRFGVTIPDEDVVIDEISTLERLSRFVAARVAAARRASPAP